MSGQLHPFYFTELPAFSLWGAGVLLAMFSSSSLLAQTEEELLPAITVSGEREEVQGESSGINVEVVDVEEFASTSTDLNELIKRTPGVVLREVGGLGSSFDLSLNGLSGQQVRYFIDGMPAENFGSALSFDNFPVNLAERIEIYKGAVPVSLGADALGGAVNIVSAGRDESMFDASVSVGSFGTTRLSLTGQLVNDNGVFYRVEAFANDTDNDYTVKEVPNVDQLGNILGSISAKRFHDGYRSNMVRLSSGVKDFSGIEELSFSLTVAGNDNEVQHPDTSINEVFGKVNSSNDTWLASVRYRQSWDRLDLDGSLLYGEIQEVFHDEFSRNYDWFGNFTESLESTQGEIGNLSRFTREDEVARAIIGAEYFLNDRFNIGSNLSINTLDRDGDDAIDVNNIGFTFPNFVNKAVFSVGLEGSYLDDRLRGSVFNKIYQYDAEINVERLVNFEEVVTRTRVNNTEYGWGASALYELRDNLSLRASLERAFRLPEPDEILGTGRFVRANPELLPEETLNLNLGFQFQSALLSGDLTLTGNAFQRDASNFIRYVADQIVLGNYENLASVDIRGVELGVAWNRGERYFASANITRQDMIEKTRVDDTGLPNLNFGSQVPNQPVLFGNMRLGFRLPHKRGFILSGTLVSNYVDDYFLNWENSGDPDTKFIIPQQLTHNVELGVSNSSRTQSLTLSLNNVFDEPAFDTFNIQKPGRAAFLKYRYTY